MENHVNPIGSLRFGWYTVAIEYICKNTKCVVCIIFFTLVKVNRMNNEDVEKTVTPRTPPTHQINKGTAFNYPFVAA